eukprot:scaffold7467_cov140-Isochrysis_galbana.AAC.3
MYYVYVLKGWTITSTYNDSPVGTSYIRDIGGPNGVALWLTLLSCAGSRGRFGDEAMSMTVSFGAGAEGAARASAGGYSMRI